MTSLTNKLIANIKSTSSNSLNYINENNVICIDSSNNRIGVNTKNPEYSIHVEDYAVVGGTDIPGIIKTNILFANNINISGGYLNDFCSNSLQIIDISTTNIDISNLLTFQTMSGNHINFNTISGNSISCEEIFFNTISGNTISSDIIFFNTISGDQNSVITVDRLNVTTLTQQGISLENLDVSENSILYDVSINNDLTVLGNSDLSSLIIHNDLSVNGHTKLNDVSLNNLTVSNTSRFMNTVNFDGSVNAITISGSRLIVNEIETTSGETFMTNGQLGSSAKEASFNILDISIINLLDKFVSVSNAIIDISKSTLILPDSSNTSLTNSVYYDSSDHLYIYNNKWNKKLFQNNFATLKLNSTISGNIINSFTGRTIDHTNNITINYDTKSYKFVPLTFDFSLGNKFTIPTDNSNRTLKISNTDTNDIYEINANISLKYINNIPNDVEANTYHFGIYLENSNNLYVGISNSILVIDKQYNYATSNINYIGNLKQDNSGIDFLISSVKDLSLLAIDSFNCTIKQLL